MTNLGDWISETEVEGTKFDADYYWRWIESQRRACWFWSDWETAMAYSDQIFRDAMAS